MSMIQPLRIPVRSSVLDEMPKSCDGKSTSDKKQLGLMNSKVRQPVRVSELLGISKSCDKKTLSSEKRSEPVKIKDLIASCSKVSPFSAESRSKATYVVPRSGRKSVRRALYGKLISPKETPSSDNTESSREKVSARKSSRKSRKSLLQPPNSIVQRHIRQLDNEAQHSIIIEERYSQIHEESEIIHQRPTVIKSTTRNIQQKHDKTPINKSISIPKIIVDKIDELEDSIDKENISPLKQCQSTTEDKCHQNDNLDLHLVGLYRSVISQMNKLELHVNEVKSQQAMQIDLLKQMYDLITVKTELSTVPVNVPDNSSAPQVLIEFKSPSNTQQINKENVMSGEKIRRKSKGIV